MNEECCCLVNPLPRCPTCDGVARPNVAMFSDWDWDDQRDQAQRMRRKQWLASVADSNARVVIIEIGAGLAIPSVRDFSEHIAQEFDAPIIRINPREPEVPSSRDIGIATGSLQALRGIDGAFLGSRSRA